MNEPFMKPNNTVPITCTAPTTTYTTRTTITNHNTTTTTTTTTTVIVGKSVDAEELAAYRYRSSNSGDSIMDWAKKMLWIGSSLVGVAVVVFGIGRLTAGRAAGAAPKRIE